MHAQGLVRTHTLGQCAYHSAGRVSPRSLQHRHGHQHIHRLPLETTPSQLQLSQLQSQIVAHAEPPSSNGDGRPAAASSSIQDSDLGFLLKLLALSIIGAVVIKYGSLAISLPFEPNAAVALAVVLGTPAAYSLYLLAQGSKQQ